MTTKHIKKYLTTLAIGEMKIKTTGDTNRLTTMAKTNKIDNGKFW